MEKVPTKSYSMKQVAERLGVSYDYVYRLCKYGTLPHFKVGKAIRITEPDLLAFINERMVNGKE